MPGPMPTRNPGQLFRSMNFGGHWAQITTFSTLVNVGPTAVAPGNSNYLAVIDGNTLFITANALAGTPSFTQIPGTPTRRITRRHSTRTIRRSCIS